jgi:asparagine synthase (glutamine-hydrolysing)
MCGIAAIAGTDWTRADLGRMVGQQVHRGPDGRGIYVSPAHTAGLGHNRLRIIDLTDAGRQPMSSPNGRFWIAFNGEIYNYIELKAELGGHHYRTRTDTEVILAAYERWGADCLHRFYGMFSMVIWDEHEQRLFAARDRFGVKPLVYHHRADGTLFIASEVKALHGAGVPAQADTIAWATYLARGWSDYSSRTFWAGAQSLPPGHMLTWKGGAITTSAWYRLSEAVGPRVDERGIEIVEEEYTALLHDAVRLRFRSDVPVGIAVSGGVDSSALLALVAPHADSIKAFTFVTGDARYDELPWVRRMLEHTGHRAVVCRIGASDVPDLTRAVQERQDEPFGGVPTLAYARLFEQAKAEGVTVLLDGQGMDEQWAGYDYYLQAAAGQARPLVQGARDATVRPDCLSSEFRAVADPFQPARPFSDAIQNLQYRDTLCAKIPRALRFNDRASMRSSVELREPFLDHRLFELAMRQPPERKIAGGRTKVLLRQLVRRLAPADVVYAPKRPVQTPQREWLRGPLSGWAEASIEQALSRRPEWFDAGSVREAWRAYCRGESDNSFYVWQWISLALISTLSTERECRRAAADGDPVGRRRLARGETCELV